MILSAADKLKWCFWIKNLHSCFRPCSTARYSRAAFRQLEQLFLCSRFSHSYGHKIKLQNNVQSHVAKLLSGHSGVWALYLRTGAMMKAGWGTETQREGGWILSGALVHLDITDNVVPESDSWDLFFAFLKGSNWGDLLMCHVRLSGSYSTQVQRGLWQTD